MITVDPLIVAALESNNFRMAHLVDLPGGLYFTDWPDNIPYGGETYFSSGHLLGLSTIKREGGIKTHDLSIKLSGVDQALIDLYESTDFSGQPCNIRRAFMDDAGAIIDVPLILYMGTLDGWSLGEGNNSSRLNLKLTNNFAANQQTSGRRSTMASQQEVLATDTFFDSAHIETSNIKWGV